MENITITLGLENLPKIETIRTDVELKESFFHEQYESAFQSIERHLRANKDNATRTIGSDNNIFAFSGDRGSGKTSCMMSVANTLRKRSNDIFVEDKYPTIRNTVFYFIQEDGKDFHKAVDPAFFDDKHNILEIVIARMFKSFSDKISGRIVENRECREAWSDEYLSRYREVELESTRAELVRDFSIVQKSLHNMLQEKNESGDLKIFEEYADSLDLRESIRKLVSDYLNFMYHCKQGNGILIIPLDDVDLHNKRAVEMMEQVRKYFQVDNVIVLMSAKIDQLTMLKRQQYAEDYNTLLDKQQIKFDTIDTMTERYISKLIPLNRRFYMPEARVWQRSKLIVFRNAEEEQKYFAELRNKDVWTQRLEGNDLKESIKRKSDKEADSFVHTKLKESATVQDTVLNLLFNKTGYLFYNTKVKTSYLVPDNFRELRQIIKLLEEMPTPNYNSLDKDPIVRQNRMVFKEFFFDTWAENNLTSDGRRLIQMFYHLNDSIYFNSTVLSTLIERFSLLQGLRNQYTVVGTKTSSKEVLDQENNQELYELWYILNKDSNKVYNISLGDVLSVINYLERQLSSTNDLKFLFMVKSLYTFLLYDYYDEMIEFVDQEEPQTSISAAAPMNLGFNDNERYQTAGLKGDLSRFNYHILVGGRFFNTRLNNLMPKDTTNTSRSNRVIYVKGLLDLIKECNKELSQLHEKCTKERETEKKELIANGKYKKPVSAKEKRAAIDEDNRIVQSNASTELESNKNLSCKVQLAEFFMLCTFRPIQHTDIAISDYYDPDFRRNVDVICNSGFGAMQEYGIFDVSAFFFNISRIEKCFKRFEGGLEFHDNIKNLGGGTLISKFKATLQDEFEGKLFKKEKQKHQWYSLTCIRSVEVLQEMMELYSVAYETIRVSDNISAIKDFFNTLVAKWKINPNKRRENINATQWQIGYSNSFKYCQHIVSLFGELTNADLKSVFDNIFAPRKNVSSVPPDEQS